MLEQTKRPPLSPTKKPAPAAAVQPVMASRYGLPLPDPFAPLGETLAPARSEASLERPRSGPQAKRGCAACGGNEACSSCGGSKSSKPTLETPPTRAPKPLEDQRADPAERQADEIGAQIARDLPAGVGVSEGYLGAGIAAVAERHLQVDLGGTRLLASAGAQAKVADEGALAVTEGRDISFAPGQLSGAHREGRELLGHELVHVAQQASGSSRNARQRQAKPGAEASAKASQPYDLLRLVEGDKYSEAFRLLNGYSMSHLLSTLTSMGYYSGLLQNNIGEAKGVNRARLELAVKVARTGKLNLPEPGWTALPAKQRDEIWKFLGTSMTNRIRMSLDAADGTEATRLASTLGMNALLDVLMNLQVEGYVAKIASQENVAPRVRAACDAVSNIFNPAVPGLRLPDVDTLAILSMEDRAALERASQRYKLPEHWDMSPEGVAQLRKDEGCSDVYYEDTNGFCTYGCGLAVMDKLGQVGPCGAKMGQKATDPDAERTFRRRIADNEKVVESAVRVPLSQAQFDELVNLAYQRNVGAFWRDRKNKQSPTDVKTSLDRGRYDEVAPALKKEGEGTAWERRSGSRGERFNSSSSGPPEVKR